jgi:hypothetical protein
MKPAAPPELLARAAEFEDLTRWERAELGRALRLLGWTYGEIREVIPVPKGTLAGWCREIRLSEDQVEAIKARVYGSRRGIPVDTQWRRRLEIEDIQRRAREDASRLRGDSLWSAGVALYWGEGAKTERRLSVANSDEQLLNLFIAWVRRFLLANAEFVLSLNLHADNDEAAARTYWSGALDIDGGRFTKTFVKPEGTGHRKNHLSNGVCRVRVQRSTDAWLTTMEWIRIFPSLLTPRPPATLPPGR